MRELVHFYQEQARISTLPWLASLQHSALQDFADLGFPTRYQEEWKYTVLDAFLQQHFLSKNKEDTGPDSAVALTDVPIGTEIRIINGVMENTLSLRDTLPAGVIIAPLAQAVVDYPHVIQPYLGNLLQHEHGFLALNTAMMQCGLFIYLPQGVTLANPLRITHWQDTPNQAVHVRHILIAETGAQATVIEDYQGKPDCAYFTNAVTEVSMASQAKLTHYKIQRESAQAYHTGHLVVKQETGSQCDSHSFSFGGKLVRSDITMHLGGSDAQCRLNGIYTPGDGQHIDHHTVVHHHAPDCRSEQNYKGILTGRSRAVFSGKIRVDKGAQHTQAQQQNKNLLLSSKAEIDTKPQLEIFADDVVCTHGATVGQLDEDALFYLATRGIGREEATRFLIQAFIVENLQLIPDRDLAIWIGELGLHHEHRK